MVDRKSPARRHVRHRRPRPRHPVPSPCRGEKPAVVESTAASRLRRNRAAALSGRFVRNRRSCTKPSIELLDAASAWPTDSSMATARGRSSGLTRLDLLKVGGIEAGLFRSHEAEPSGALGQADHSAVQTCASWVRVRAWPLDFFCRGHPATVGNKSRNLDRIIPSITSLTRFFTESQPGGQKDPEYHPLSK